MNNEPDFCTLVLGLQVAVVVEIKDEEEPTRNLESKYFLRSLLILFFLFP